MDVFCMAGVNQQPEQSNFLAEERKKKKEKLRKQQKAPHIN